MVNELAKLQREIERKRAARAARVAAWFVETVREVGEVEARRQWAEVLKRKPGKPRGTTNADRDAYLLLFVDELLRSRRDGKSRAADPRRIGEHLAKANPGEFGPSAGAITTKIRRLLKQRKPERGGNALKALEVTLSAGKWPIGWPLDEDK